MRKEVIVGGYDVAHISSGITFVKGRFTGNDILLDVVAEKSFTITNDFLSRYRNAKLMLNDSIIIKNKYGLDLCVIEDYINTSFSHVAFSMGEFNGICRAFHYGSGLPVMLNVPGRIRSFIANGRPIPKGEAGKRAMVKWCEEDFGYVSTRPTVKERSDCSDAFVHAVIGVYALFFLQGVPLEILPPKRRAIFRNPKKNGILDDTPRFMFNRDKLADDIVLTV